VKSFGLKDHGIQNGSQFIEKNCRFLIVGQEKLKHHGKSSVNKVENEGPKDRNHS
jgi:hypothetical protein